MQRRFLVAAAASRCSRPAAPLRDFHIAALVRQISPARSCRWQSASHVRHRQRRHLSAGLTASDQSSSHVRDLITEQPARASHGTSPSSFDANWQDRGIENLISRLDPFLPRSLRISDDASSDIRPAEELPELLHQIRKQIPGGLIPQLVPGRGHWDAFVYIAEALADLTWQSERAAGQIENLHSHSPWSRSSTKRSKLAVLTQEPLDFPATTQAPAFPVTLSDSSAIQSKLGHRDVTHLHQAMGEVWLALGELVIEATESDQYQSRHIIDTVLQVLAHLHSRNHVPESTYQYDPDEVPIVRRKPPYLHLMSSRIMTAISDATWQAQRHEFKSLYDSGPKQRTPYNRELIIEASRSHLHAFPISTWLELILWCCSTNGHFLQAGMLLSEIFSGGTTREWIAFSWQEVLLLQKDHHRRAQSWFDQVASIAEGWSGERPLVEMEPESVSAEVVQVIFDGLVARGHESEEIRRLIGTLLEAKVRLANAYLTTAKSIDCNSSIAQALNYCLINGVAIADIYMDAKSYTYDANRQTLLESPRLHSEDESLSTIYGRNSMNPVHTFLVSALDKAVADGNIMEAKATLTRIERLAEVEKPGTRQVDIPSILLADTIRLAVRTKHLDLAKKIVYESKLIPTSPKEDFTLQPALLQFAIAASDDTLLSDIFEQFKLHADRMEFESVEGLLEAQIHFNKIEGLGRIFWHLTKKRQRAVPPRLIAALAVKLLDETPGATAENLRREVALKLRKILGREYMPARKASDVRDYTAHRQISQLARIFASAGGTLGEVAAKFAEVSNPQLASPVSIDTPTFNIVLEAVTHHKGWDSSRVLLERWCNFDSFTPDDQPHVADGIPLSKPRFGTSGEQIVKPDLASVQMALPKDADLLMREFLGDKQNDNVPSGPVAHSRSETRVQTDWIEVEMPEQVKWAIQQYQRMNLSDEEIERLIPSLSRVLEASGEE